MRFRNPIAFRPPQVTFWTTILYLGLLIPLLYIHENVPPAPRSVTPYPGINLAAAWKDLTKITKAYHPYNSRDNDVVRAYLLQRIRNILNENDVQWVTEGSDTGSRTWAQSAAAVVFDDKISNLTIVTGGSGLGTNIGEHKCAVGTYFEGSNIIVYIRGTNDEPGEWWKKPDERLPSDKGGVLVNAHFDSASSGYGATDDGMGVVTVLQLISYFTTPDRQPKHGIVALLNNGEEDFLWGARAFGQSPLMPFVHTFLNLEGAGAGGRAILFRTSDLEVTKAYSKAPHPFGSVVAADGFSMGLIRSQTDYVILNGIFGQRGLDLAFYEPRARYHTNQDDARHTSRASLWHMMSAAIKTVENLSGDAGDTFSGPRQDEDAAKVQNGHGTSGVWFDMWGVVLALFSLNAMFVWSMCLLTVGPVILGVVTWLLIRADKYYFWAGKVRIHEGITDDPVSLKGRHGFSRFPVAFIASTGLVIGSAFLLAKVNPLIVYSSSYAVFAMMLSLYYVFFWMFMRGADFHLPSALHRGFALMWLFAITWLILIVVTFFEKAHKIASGYPFVILHSGVLLAMLTFLLEMFRLPGKESFAQWTHDVHQIREDLEAVAVHYGDANIVPSPGEVENRSTVPEDDEDVGPANETTPLIGGGGGASGAAGAAGGSREGRWEVGRQTFATGYRQSISSIVAGPGKNVKEAYGEEQNWSGRLPSSLWILQLLFMAPMPVLLLGQLALFIVAATSGTGADGSSLLFPYAVIAAFSVLLILPITPFIHRVTFHIPLALLAVVIGTVIYCLVAFPFSAENRYKVYFQQHVNLDTGKSVIAFDGLEEYVRPVISELPSSSGKEVNCSAIASRKGLVSCAYDGSGLLPHPRAGIFPSSGTNNSLANLVSITVTRPDSSENKAVLEIDAVNTKACFVKFKQPITSFTVEGSSPLDQRFGQKADVCMMKLWRRDWKKVWRVAVEWSAEAEEEDVYELEQESGGLMSEQHSDELKARWAGDGGGGGDSTGEEYAMSGVQATGLGGSELKGEVVCIWSDANMQGTIPAFDEALRYAPTWVAVTKVTEALVEGKKAFVA